MGGGVAYTKGNSFVFNNWIEEPFDLSPADISQLDLPGGKKAGLVLRFRDQELVVLDARAVAHEHNNSTKKRQIEFIGRTMDAIRKATTYFTAVSTTSISFYVASEVERDHLLHLVELNTHVNPMQSPVQSHHAVSAAAGHIPMAVPVLTPLQLPPASHNQQSQQNQQNQRVKQVIDDGFKALEDANGFEERQEWQHALKAYESARRCFNQACPQIPSEKASTRNLLLQKCDEIQETIAQLHERLAPPPSTVPDHFTLTVPPAQIPTAPPPQPISPMNSPSVETRLHQIQKFAEKVEIKRAQEEKKADASDLALRLAALKRETTVVPPINSLEERLRKLRGGNDSTPTSPPMQQDPIDVLLDLNASDELESVDPQDLIETDTDVAPTTAEVASILQEAQNVLKSTPCEAESESAQVENLINQITQEVAQETSKDAHETDPKPS